MNDVDNFVKIILAVSVSLSVVGISIQFMRLLGTTNSILRDAHGAVKDVVELIANIKEDYRGIAVKFGEITDGISSIKTNVVDPLNRFSNTVGAFVDVMNKKVRGEAV